MIGTRKGGNGRKFVRESIVRKLCTQLRNVPVSVLVCNPGICNARSRVREYGELRDCLRTNVIGDSLLRFSPFHFRFFSPSPPSVIDIIVNHTGTGLFHDRRQGDPMGNQFRETINNSLFCPSQRNLSIPIIRTSRKRFQRDVLRHCVSYDIRIQFLFPLPHFSPLLSPFCLFRLLLSSSKSSQSCITTCQKSL